MGPAPRHTPSDPPKTASHAVRVQLARVLESPVFQRADRISALLEYLVEATLDGNNGRLKESVIGVDVFRREAGYDPKLDPVVRVSARRLRHKIDEYYAGPGQTDPIRIQIDKGGYVPVFVPNPSAGNGAEEPARSASPTAVAPSVSARAAGWRWLFPAALLVICAIALFVLLQSAKSTGGIVDGKPFTTLPGYAAYPSISPDGSALAFAWDGPSATTSHIYIQRIGADSAARLTDDPHNELAPVWSPEGDQIAFLRDIDGSRAAIHIAPVLGGGDRIVTELQWPENDRASLDWSPDGRWFATFERAPPENWMCIVLISRATGEKRLLTSPSGGTFGDSSPRFSPDGRYVAFRRSTGMAVDDLYVVAVAGGQPRRVSYDQREITSLAWSADGKSLIVSSKRAGFIAGLWSFPVQGGSPRRLTPTNADCIQPAVSLRGDKLAFVQLMFDVNTWAAPVNGSAPARPLLDSTLVDSSPQFSPDGSQIAFRSSRSGADEVWVSDRSGRNPRRLTRSNGALTGSPRWSPDGERIVYESRMSGSAQVYVMSADGSRQTRLTFDSFNNSLPGWSHDGKYIYFASDRSGAWQIWRQPVDGIPAVQITSHGGFAGWESKDGHNLYFARNDAPGVWSIDLGNTGAGERLVTSELDKTMWGNWALGAQGIYYIADRSLRYLAFNGASREILKLTAPPAAMDSGLAVSADERTLLFCQVDRMGSGIVLVDPFK